MNLSYHTVHLAVKYLDYFMDGHSIVLSQLRFVAVCCIILASKMVEVDEEVSKDPDRIKLFTQSTFDFRYLVCRLLEPSFLRRTPKLVAFSACLNNQFS